MLEVAEVDQLTFIVATSALEPSCGRQLGCIYTLNGEVHVSTVWWTVCLKWCSASMQVHESNDTMFGLFAVLLLFPRLPWSSCVCSSWNSALKLQALEFHKPLMLCITCICILDIQPALRTKFKLYSLPANVPLLIVLVLRRSYTFIAIELVFNHNIMAATFMPDCLNRAFLFHWLQQFPDCIIRTA